MDNVACSIHRIRDLFQRAAFVCFAVAVLLGSMGVGVALAEAPDEGVQRYQVLRTRVMLIRYDTRSGQIWTAPLAGDGGWQSIGSPAPGPESTVDGRYAVRAMGPPKPPAGLGGPPGALELIRMDMESGQSWITQALPGQEWLLLGEPELASTAP
jgi:hypothetical protein